MDMRQFWFDVRACKKGLDVQHPSGFCFITNSGTATEVTTEAAAQAVVRRTHTLSTKEEVARHQRQQSGNRALLQAAEAKRIGGIAVSLEAQREGQTDERI